MKKKIIQIENIQFVNDNSNKLIATFYESNVPIKWHYYQLIIYIILFDFLSN